MKGLLSTHTTTTFSVSLVLHFLDGGSKECTSEDRMHHGHSVACIYAVTDLLHLWVLPPTTKYAQKNICTGTHFCLFHRTFIHTTETTHLHHHHHGMETRYDATNDHHPAGRRKEKQAHVWIHNGRVYLESKSVRVHDIPDLLVRDFNGASIHARIVKQ